MRFERYVVAYDVANTKRRNRIYKLLKGWGERVNYSVFECEIRRGKLKVLRKEIRKLINRNEDVVIYYPLCLNCLAGVLSDGMEVSRNLDNVLVTV